MDFNQDCSVATFLVWLDEANILLKKLITFLGVYDGAPYCCVQ